MNSLSQPLISIILPTYNVGPYIEQCLSSIATQSYTNLELILIDDGSDDGTFEKCQAYAKDHPNTKLLSTPHKGSGCAVARNMGLKEVSGDYIGFVDGDDWLEPIMYEKLLNAITSDTSMEVGKTIATSGFYVATPESNKSEIKDVFSNELTILNTHDALMHLIEDNTIQSYLWNKLFPRELFDGIEFPTQRAYSDLATMHKLFLRTDAVITVPAPLYYYRQWNGSISRTGSILSDFNLHDAYDKQLNAISTVYPDLESSIRERNLRLEISTCFFYRKQSASVRTEYLTNIQSIRATLMLNKTSLLKLGAYQTIPLGIRLRAFFILACPYWFKIHV